MLFEMVKVQNVFFQHGQLYLELFENPRCAIADRVGCFGRGDLHLTANLTQQPSGRLMVTTGSHDMLMCFIGVIKRNDLERFVGPVTSFTRPMRWSGTFTPLSFPFGRLGDAAFAFLRLGNLWNPHAVGAGNDRLIRTILPRKVRPGLCPWCWALQTAAPCCSTIWRML